MTDFIKATEQYKSEPTVQKLRDLASELCSQMTKHEKIKTLQGHAMGITLQGLFAKGRFYNYKPYPAGGCKRLKIPPVLFTDGPRGIVAKSCTCFPVPMLRGAAFDYELEYRVGQAMAKEAIASGANLFAGICINLLRNPKWGRAQETYGEDPFLLGKMGEALTRAMQENGVIACPKHYALNSIEDLRFSADARADKRTLHDVYLPHFKKCIDAGAMSIMGAYNKVNGTYCCENKTLLTDILRDKWGFEGFALSDFFYGIYSPSKSLKAGMDVEMPYTFRYSVLPLCLKSGSISQEDIDLSVQRVLRALIKANADKKEYPKSVILSKEHTDLAREVAAKGTVLLKNKDKTLPIPHGRRIAVIGRYANKINTGDHGSSNVFSPYTVTAFEGLAEKFVTIFSYTGSDIAEALHMSSDADYVVVCVGSDWLQEGEFLVNLGSVKKKPKGSGGDRASLTLPEEDIALINALAETGKKIIVNVMGGSAYIMNGWIDRCDAVLMSFYSGIEGGNALADIITGAVSPSGKLPFTIAKDENDYPDFLHLGAKDKRIDYGYYHGYTLFDKKGIEPLFPFGFGLSYTEFNIEQPNAVLDGDKIRVTAKVTNIGKVKGDAVLQVYVSSDNKQADRPLKLLKGFGRVTLEKNESTVAEISVELGDIGFYNEETDSILPDSSYRIYIGQSSRDLSFAGEIKTEEA